MDTPIKGFYDLVVRDYDGDVGKRWRDKYAGRGDNEKVPFQEAMDFLNEVVLNGREAPLPSFGRTNSIPRAGRLVFEE